MLHLRRNGVHGGAIRGARGRIGDGSRWRFSSRRLRCVRLQERRRRRCCRHRQRVRRARGRHVGVAHVRASVRAARCGARGCGAALLEFQ
jgi:hypothetical protein